MTFDKVYEHQHQASTARLMKHRLRDYHMKSCDRAEKLGCKHTDLIS